VAETGFSSSAYFSKLFKNRFEVTPSEMIKQREQRLFKK